MRRQRERGKITLQAVISVVDLLSTIGSAIGGFRILSLLAFALALAFAFASAFTFAFASFAVFVEAF